MNIKKKFVDAGVVLLATVMGVWNIAAGIEQYRMSKADWGNAIDSGKGCPAFGDIRVAAEEVLQYVGTSRPVAQKLTPFIVGVGTLAGGLAGGHAAHHSRGISIQKCNS